MLKYIAIHHAGGLGGDIYASTKHLTLEQINNAHRARWGDFKSSMDYWVGYNFLIFPKDGKIVQTRAIGEKTAAQKYHNEDTISVCVVGNFMKRPDGNPVDVPTEAQKQSLEHLLMALLENDDRHIKRSIFSLSGTQEH